MDWTTKLAIKIVDGAGLSQGDVEWVTREIKKDLTAKVKQLTSTLRSGYFGNPRHMAAMLLEIEQQLLKEES